MKISEKLQIIQKVSGLTQEKIAAQLGVSFVAFNNWITGKSQPRPNKKQAIDELYLTLTGQKIIPADQIEAKKQIVSTRSKKLGHIIKLILNRQDLLDELTLKLTYHTNRIEGSTLTENETAKILFENISLKNHSLSEQLEAKNHQTAFRFLLDYLSDNQEVNLELILRLHAILLNGINSDAGFFRRQGVRIIGANITTANWVKVPDLMNQLIKDLQKSKNEIIGQVAQIHSRFEAIHPFSDGNGRIGRLLIQAMLLTNNLAPAIITQENKSIYIKYLNISQTKGDFSLLEDFICDSMFLSLEILEDK